MSQVNEAKQTTILDKIVADKEIWLAERMQQQPLASFIDEVVPTDRDFYQALSGSPAKFILECKKASPSKGLIRPEFDLDLIAGVYKHYAAAISVLTDSKYFQGEFDYVTTVRQQVPQPVLCKDFFIDEYQIYLARYHQADAILLMLSVLDDNEYSLLAEVAHKLKLGVLTEVSNQQELERAIALNAKVIGINNRNLRDLSITLDRTPELARQIPEDRIIISESGIYKHQQVRELSKYANGFLVGSSLMSQDDVDLACRKLILGENKVCGLTRDQDVVAAHQAGAVYGGLIFAEKSPRAVSLKLAEQLVSAAPLNFVGVFVNSPVEQVAEVANHLKLHAVQLHGDEDEQYIAQLKDRLTHSLVWKALAVDQELPTAPINADKVLFDSKVAGQCGGTGQAFDWQLLGEHSHGAMLAGGINPDNIQNALAFAAAGLDLNSGVEQAPGIKDPAKIKTAFEKIRQY
ncbi:bifunctional indole-3-glycerol-phosphate synthase TrpC/phosphoribosylanthranilate isomerase TrpF [Agarivorans sp. TSD2052]|uniref:bifunctional indole-3-glycerol-phosphate synthase TrpC/phosphoribosylanthranilate isomerase TrpF n=1 Tax=Agarivorans sp. TSD2052 TaxID=2937286 RepID=UPI00200D6932|nr:bifunctional indole-3-glycerol-phosphate synthase TrpC/phosphoribosylanthranilate isomerase TrpF [Agarivorans sp. TSD2052]UPW17117.1 bifunctional indole-3-glycerol-phosphate synthase TrpC/phosphoribosylanthranilate isomerase TrpF [Agarivorans sp. TSD2052]